VSLARARAEAEGGDWSAGGGGGLEAQLGGRMTARGPERALAYCRVEKEVAREVAAISQIMRKQKELLPLIPSLGGRGAGAPERGSQTDRPAPRDTRRFL